MNQGELPQLTSSEVFQIDERLVKFPWLKYYEVDEGVELEKWADTKEKLADLEKARSMVNISDAANVKSVFYFLPDAEGEGGLFVRLLRSDSYDSTSLKTKRESKIKVVSWTTENKEETDERINLIVDSIDDDHFLFALIGNHEINRKLGCEVPYLNADGNVPTISYLLGPEDLVGNPKAQYRAENYGRDVNDYFEFTDGEETTTVGTNYVDDDSFQSDIGVKRKPKEKVEDPVKNNKTSEDEEENTDDDDNEFEDEGKRKGTLKDVVEEPIFVMGYNQDNFENSSEIFDKPSFDFFEFPHLDLSVSEPVLQTRRSREIPNEKSKAPVRTRRTEVRETKRNEKTLRVLKVELPKRLYPKQESQLSITAEPKKVVLPLVNVVKPVEPTKPKVFPKLSLVLKKENKEPDKQVTKSEVKSNVSEENKYEEKNANTNTQTKTSNNESKNGTQVDQKVNKKSEKKHVIKDLKEDKKFHLKKEFKLELEKGSLTKFKLKPEELKINKVQKTQQERKVSTVKLKEEKIQSLKVSSANFATFKSLKVSLASTKTKKSKAAYIMATPDFSDTSQVDESKFDELWF